MKKKVAMRGMSKMERALMARRAMTASTGDGTIRGVNDVIANCIPADSLSDDRIKAMAYGIEYFDSYAAGIGKADAMWWAENRPSYMLRLRSLTPPIETAPQVEPAIVMVCRQCGCSTIDGAMFSTAPAAAGVCDDCF